MLFEQSIEISDLYLLKKANWIPEITTKGERSKTKNILQKYLHIILCQPFLAHYIWTDLPYSNKFDRGSNLKYFKFQNLKPITRD